MNNLLKWRVRLGHLTQDKGSCAWTDSFFNIKCSFKLNRIFLGHVPIVFVKNSIVGTFIIMIFLALTGAAGLQFYLQLTVQYFSGHLSSYWNEFEKPWKETISKIAPDIVKISKNTKYSKSKFIKSSTII